MTFLPIATSSPSAISSTQKTTTGTSSPTAAVSRIRRAVTITSRGDPARLTRIRSGRCRWALSIRVYFIAGNGHAITVRLQQLFNAVAGLVHILDYQDDPGPVVLFVHRTFLVRSPCAGFGFLPSCQETLSQGGMPVNALGFTLNRRFIAHFEVLNRVCQANHPPAYVYISYAGRPYLQHTYRRLPSAGRRRPPAVFRRATDDSRLDLLGTIGQLRQFP